MKLPTVLVRLKDGSEVIINASDFNGDIHERADTPKPKAAPAPKPAKERKPVPAKSQPKSRRR